ncbi:hypothetical protein [Tateyamaria pelophila]|uniref:hypothetical protein n=1 Tax=Tateyamaria pelophila TaxID=328415 RepID=UPI001CBE135D|nr:hypothetical protein [Tateyamaria pelophila]
MDSDLYLTLGIVLAVFSIPSLVSAFTYNRSLRASALATLIAGGLVFYAFLSHPGGYSLQDIPDALVRVAARVIH